MTGARGHRIGVGDLIISRRNDPTIDLHAAPRHSGQPHSVRNGNRWRVAGIDPATNRVAAERLDDGARVVFEDDYLREHVSLGYAVTVHSAQGVTADTTHAVLGENTTRSLLYVAMTRGRHTNTAYLYERTSATANTATKNPPAPTSCPAATVETPPTSSAPSWPTTTQHHSPHTTTPHKRQAQRCPTASAHFSTVERQLHAVDEQPTRPGAPKQRLTHSP